MSDRTHDDDVAPGSGPALIDRRRMLTTLAGAAGLATAGPLATRLAAAAQVPIPPPTNVRMVSKRVLTKSDLQYLGAMRVAMFGVNMGFSYGGLTGRKVNGKVQLLMSGSVIEQDPIFEFVDTGQYHQDPNQAPRMPLAKAWGNIYGNARRTWRKDGTEKTGYPRYPGSLQWNDATQMLYWTFLDTYNTTGDEDWCLGGSRLTASGPEAFGPWRPSGGGKKGPWRCVQLSQHPSGAMLCGSGISSGNVNSPWGPDLWSGAFPTAQTPAGFTAPDLPVQKYLTYYPMVGKVNADGSFSGPIRAMRRPGDYVFEPVGGILTEIDPLKNGGTGTWTQLDTIGGTAWVDLPDVHGVLFFGKFAAGHVWYRNAGLGNDKCTHGQQSPVDITGGVSTSGYPMLLFYDPADLEAVRAGRKVDYTVDPIQIVNLEAQYQLQTAPMTQVGSAKGLGGAYFDRDSRRIYVAAPGADPTIPGMLNPLVHVFQIK